MQFLHTVYYVIFNNLYNQHSLQSTLLLILFTANTCIVMKKMVLGMIMSIKKRIININGRSQTNRDQKSNLLFLQRHYQSQKNFESNLLKIDKKHCKGINIYYIGYITIKKIDDCESIYSVNPLYLQVNHASGYIEEKMRINI